MLEGLETIDWSRLRHAYGEAVDVPGQLRALLAAEEEARQEALGDLYSNIWHQGTVYEASAYAVPFLIELLEEPSVPERMGIAHLLRELATGRSYLAVHERPPVSGRDESPELEERRREELEWVRAAHAAVVEGLPVYLRLLADPDPDLRMVAPYLLAVCEERVAEIAPVLREWLTAEPVPQAKASAALGFAELYRRADARELTAGVPRERWRDDLLCLARADGEDPLVRGAAVLALGELSGAGPDGDLLPVLVASIPLMGASEEFPWWSDLPLLSIDARLAPYPERRQEFVLALLQHPDAEIREQATRAAGSLCRERHGPEHALAPVLGELLSDPAPAVQEAAARTLAELGPAASPAREALLSHLEVGSAHTRVSVAAAVAALGEGQAVPCLIRLLEEVGEQPIRLTALDSVRRLALAAGAAVPVLRSLLRPQGYPLAVRHRAAATLGEMGPMAHAALPDLIAALQDPELASGAAAALARWGGAAAPAIPALCGCLRHGDSFVRRTAVGALGAIGPEAAEGLTALEELLADPEANVRAHAALALWRIGESAELAVPPLVDILVNLRSIPGVRSAGSTAAEHLAIIGPPAREAVPALRDALDYPSHWIQIHAARALWRVAGEVEAVLPILLQHLRVDPAGLRVLECLEEMGPRAQAAAPELRRIVESERRLLEVGSHASWIEEDEAFRAAAARALDRIEGSVHRKDAE